MIDSLGQVELIMALEAAFDLQAPDNDAKKIQTIRHAIELIDKLEAKQDKKKSKKKQ
jgi:acyl carrier protein